MRKNTKKIRTSLMCRTWLYFVCMTLTILAVLWCAEIVFFKSYFQAQREHEIRKACSTLVDSFTGVADERYYLSAESEVNNNSLLLVVFELPDEGNEVVPMMYLDPTGRDRNETVSMLPGGKFKLEDDFIKNIEAGKTHFSYRTRIKSDAYALVEGRVKDTPNGKVCFYVSSLVMPINVTVALLANQLIVVTCICIIVSVLLAVAFSRSITRPINEFTATARKLGKGDKVRFSDTGYIEFDELAHAFNHSSDELDKTEKLRRDLLSNVSHDLRTPLTMVKAYAEMIRDISGKDEKKRTEHCKVIIDEVDRLTLLVNDLLDLSKLQAGTREPEMSEVNITQTVRNVMERLSILATRDGYKFELDVDEDCVAICDERMIEQVLYNLIGNAVSYTGEDKRVIIRLKKTESGVRAEISDTGRGIAPSERDKVWDRYYRASQTKRAVVGSGIGLSIVKSLFEAHKARYGIESVVNNGTTFWFELEKEEKNNA